MRERFDRDIWQHRAVVQLLQGGHVGGLDSAGLCQRGGNQHHQSDKAAMDHGSLVLCLQLSKSRRLPAADKCK